MPLGFLSAPSEDELTIELDVSRPDAVRKPRDVIEARVTLTVQKDTEVREVRAGLVRWERCQEIRRTRSSKGGSSTSRVWRVIEDWPDRAVVMSAGTIPAGTSRAINLQLEIPSDPPPSGAGKITQLRWMVKATVDIPRAVDANVEREVIVEVPAGEATDAPGQYGQGSDPKAAVMQLQLPGLAAARGEELRGRWLVTAVSGMNARGARVDLVREETVSTGHRQNSATEVVVSQTLANSIRLEPGIPSGYDFALAIPTDACPSRQTQASTVRWKVKGVLDRAWRQDARVEQEILVCGRSAVNGSEDH